MRFEKVLESRHGVITVDGKRRVYGNGVYDGEIKTDLAQDWHVRPYFLSAVHPNPREVLIVGMSAGVWTQIIASHPTVERVSVVEISEAYLDLIRSAPEVASILQNPKVEVSIDDGRRWMKRNHDRRFDAIVMNTTFHWREFASSLLSREFLELAKSRLKPGGIVMWNCTGSARAIRTGMDVFPHTMMCLNNCIGSVSPLQLSKDRWRDVLLAYQIDQRPAIDLTRPDSQSSLESILRLLDNEEDPANGSWWYVVHRELMQKLWGSAAPITDDNLGHEYEL
jgi:spermidine synthase